MSKNKQNYDYDLVIIGSGAGGSVAADMVASAGKRVAVVESDTLGGQCPNWGCIPTKALLEAARVLQTTKTADSFGIRSSSTGFNFPSVQAWKDHAVRRTGVETTSHYYKTRGIGVFKGRAHFISPHEISVNRRHISAANFLIATGAQWRPLGAPLSSQVNILNPRSALELKRPPKSLFIIGGGSVGVEFAELFASFGTQVYIAEESPRLLPREDQEVSHLVEAVFTKRRRIHVLNKAKITNVTMDAIHPRVAYMRGGEQHSVKVEHVLLANGKQPSVDIGLENAGVEYTDRGIEVDEYLQTSAKHIFAAGDVLGTNMYTHVGVYESRNAAHNILHRQKVAVDYRAVPRVTFVAPEVASVGMSEEDCLRRDMPIMTGIAPINSVARANVANAMDGFAKVITDKNGTLIGGSVVSEHAGEVIHELTLAIQHRLHAHDIARMLHAYPTWSDSLRLACNKIK